LEEGLGFQILLIVR